LTQVTDRFCSWRSTTTGNITLRHATTQALSLELQASLSARLTLVINGQRYEYSLAELAYAGRCHYLRGWLSEAIQIGRLVPGAECKVDAEFMDPPEQEVDCYRLRVAQTNGQWAWLTPIWVEK
jgi:hypothetical protein